MSKATEERKPRIFVVEGEPQNVATRIANMYSPNAEAREMFTEEDLPKHSSRMYGVFLFPDGTSREIRDAVFQTSKLLPLFLDTIVTDNVREPKYAVVSAGYSPKYKTGLTADKLREMGFVVLDL